MVGSYCQSFLMAQKMHLQKRNPRIQLKIQINPRGAKTCYHLDRDFLTKIVATRPK